MLMLFITGERSVANLVPLTVGGVGLVGESYSFWDLVVVGEELDFMKLGCLGKR